MINLLLHAKDINCYILLAISILQNRMEWKRNILCNKSLFYKGSKNVIYSIKIMQIEQSNLF